MRTSAIVIALMTLVGAQAEGTPPSIEDFCANDQIISPELSPDGTKIIYLTTSGRELSLALYEVASGKAGILLHVDSDIESFFWKDDDRILYTGGGIPTLVSMSLGKRSLKKLAGMGTIRGFGSVYDWLPADPHHILVTLPRIELMDVETGEVEYKQPEDVLDFVGPYIADTAGTLRLRCQQWKDRIELQHRQTDRDAFVTVHTWTWNEPFVHFLGFAGDHNTAYILTQDDGDMGVLHGFSTKTFTFGPPIASFPDAEIKKAIYSRDHLRLIGVRVDDRNGGTNYWIDGNMRRIQAGIDSALAGRRNLIVSISQDVTELIVLSSSGSDPGAYYLVDRRKGALLPLGRKHPQVDPEKLGTTTEQDFEARDGFRLHAVLTLPPHGSKGPHPLVLVPENRIFDDRASVAYNPIGQFLASRGYSYLIVDYRGSSGYGRKYEDAGRHEISGKIPDDIEDAADWSVAAGYAKRGQICIFGSDFGGTLALVAATYSPDLYCCIINQDGEPDLTKLGNGRADIDWLSLKRMQMFVGYDTAALAKRSPLLALDQLRSPILNIYENPLHDMRWDRLESGLKHAKRPYSEFKALTPFRDLRPVDYRLNYFHQVGDFLNQNLEKSFANTAN